MEEYVYLLVQTQNISRRIPKKNGNIGMRRETLSWGKVWEWDFHCLPFVCFYNFVPNATYSKVVSILFFLSFFPKFFPDLPPLPAILILYRTTPKGFVSICYLYFLIFIFFPIHSNLGFIPTNSTKAGHYNLHLYPHFILSTLLFRHQHNYSLLEVISFVDF